jgi:hypothetical protein
MQTLSSNISTSCSQQQRLFGLHEPSRCLQQQLQYAMSATILHSPSFRTPRDQISNMITIHAFLQRGYSGRWEQVYDRYLCVFRPLHSVPLADPATVLMALSLHLMIIAVVQSPALVEFVRHSYRLGNTGYPDCTTRRIRTVTNSCLLQ